MDRNDFIQYKKIADAGNFCFLNAINWNNSAEWWRE